MNLNYNFEVATVERNLTKKAERIKEKERLSAVITNKMLVVFLSLIFAVAVLVRVSSKGSTELGFLRALPYLQIAFGLLTAAALVWFIISERRSMDARYIVLSAPLLLGLSASGLFAVLMYAVLGGAFRTVLALLAFTVLFFIFEIYSIDFFAASVSAVTACLMAAVANSAGVAPSMRIAAYAVCAVIVALICGGGAYFVYRLYTERRIDICGRKFRKPQHVSPAAVYAVFAVSVLAFAASLVFGYLLYCIAAVAVVFFVAALIYTVKLI